jgi:hypothetical protein
MTAHWWLARRRRHPPTPRVFRNLRARTSNHSPGGEFVSGFWLHLQSELDQAADGLGSTGVVILAPRINLLGQVCRETHGTDGIDATLFFRTATRFLVYRN